ncbi:hypothetical protein OG394_31330 [Kribbella sp. NBC_01245]|uniref:type II toxin-antitoxin system RelE family toxin n=1 Tax=Kribbella sp. NBC_01245 TaxID=2903578 RepID=UPI002E2D3AD8|nr:hypothetical protein [Kribbella sp. NBC_01245]
MTYRVEFHAAALAQLKGLPGEAFDALVKRTVDLVEQPWDAQAISADDAHFRQALFGEFGLLSFYVDDTNQLIRIFDVTWV